MRTRRLIGAAAAASVLLLLLGIAGCTAPTPAVAPIVVNVDDLRGATVEVPLNSTLIIITDWSDVDGYTAEIADPAIADFARGANTGDASYSPRLTPTQVGETAVTLSSENGGIRDLEFTLEVTPVPTG